MDIFIGLLTTAVALALLSFVGYKYTEYYTDTTHFVCPNCRSAFKLSKASFILALKTGVPDERIVSCPVCGYRGRMPLIKD